MLITKNRYPAKGNGEIVAKNGKNEVGHPGLDNSKPLPGTRVGLDDQGKRISLDKMRRVSGRPSMLAYQKAIRKMCVECMGGAYSEIPRCTSPKCPLFPYRLGPGKEDEAQLIPAQAAPYVRPDEVGRGHVNQPNEEKTDE